MRAVLRLLEYSGAMLSYRRKLSFIAGVSAARIDELYKEMESSAWLSELIKKTGMRRGIFDLSMLSYLRAPVLYALVRLASPEAVVETGVANGFSSVFILQALERNGGGRLYSIDLPEQPGEELHGKKTGWLIPEELKHRWRLTLGSSAEKLPNLLDELGEIGFFYHDSDHSYENMAFEFCSAMPRLKNGSFMVSDDITDNRAFEDFCSQQQARNIRLFKFGVIRKDA